MPSLDSRTQRLIACGECGARVVGGTSGCRSIFDQMMKQDFFGEPNRRLHHLVHNAYVLQHPGSRSNQSVAIHLTSMCWLLEAQGRPAWDLLPASVLTRLSMQDSLPKLHIGNPAVNLNILHVWGHRPEEYPDRVESWANAVWQSWSPYHDQARDWLTGR